MDFTLPRIAYDLWDIIRNSKIIDDDNIDIRQFYEWIHQQRALWIKNHIGKGFDIDNNILQDWYSPVILVDSSLDPKIPSGEYYLRTQYPIERLVELNYGIGVLEITSSNMKRLEFSVVPWNQLRFSGENKWTKRGIFVSQMGDHYYIKYANSHQNPYNITNINIKGIFENPTLVPNYDIETSTYPLNRWMYNFMREQIINVPLMTILKTRNDSRNDSADNINQQ